MKDGVITKTVGLPIYKGREIAWLALESLCRQEKAGIWELIVFEDGDGEWCNEHYFAEFIPRLREAGMRRFKYISSKKRHPLSLKWREIAQQASDTSNWFLMQAADAYSDKLTLAHTTNAEMKGADYFAWNNGHFYNIETEGLMRYLNHHKRSGLSQLVKTHIIKALPKEELWRGVDGWIFDHIKRGRAHVTSMERLGLSTDGCNTISLNRRKFYDMVEIMNGFGSFTRAKKPVNELVPDSVLKKLRLLKKQNANSQ